MLFTAYFLSLSSKGFYEERLFTFAGLVKWPIFYNNLSLVVISLLLLCRWGGIKAQNILMRLNLLPRPAHHSRVVKLILLLLGCKTPPHGSSWSDHPPKSVQGPGFAPTTTCTCAHTLSAKEKHLFSSGGEPHLPRASQGPQQNRFILSLSPQGNWNLGPDETSEPVLWWEQHISIHISHGISNTTIKSIPVTNRKVRVGLWPMTTEWQSTWENLLLLKPFNNGRHVLPSGSCGNTLQPFNNYAST